MRTKPTIVIFCNPNLGKSDEDNSLHHESKRRATSWQPGLPQVMTTKANFESIDIDLRHHKVIYEMIDCAYYIYKHSLINRKEGDLVFAVTSIFNCFGRTHFPGGNGHVDVMADGTIIQYSSGNS